MSNWTKELPTKPGLYAWCDGTGRSASEAYIIDVHRVTEAYIIDAHRVTYEGELHGTFTGGGKTCRCAAFGGLWQPLHVELPPAYVPPKLPKVEWYSAKHNLSGSDRVLAKIGNRYIATAACGGTVGDGTWNTVATYYTDIERVPDETTTR